jgi:hypothetical protein
VAEVVDDESPAFSDVTGDGVPELVFATAGRFGWAAPSADPRAPWTFHPLSLAGPYQAFTHGLGVADLTGDGRPDVIDTTGFWEQPASLTGDPLWIRRDVIFGNGGAQMLCTDVDGDGDTDVVTSLDAHGYGLSWYQQWSEGFRPHPIVPPEPTGGDTGVVLHEPHALALGDIDGDGVNDLVTGERFWGHVPGGNPDFGAPARLYWFETRRSPLETLFTPHLIDDASGVGTQVVAGDVDGDGLVDILVSNKKGTFLFLQTPGSGSKG